MAVDDTFLQQLRATFVVEAREHVQTLSHGLLQLEKAITDSEKSGTVETMFRSVHSLKGAARAVELVEIESICQSLEEVFAAWRREYSTPRPEVIDLLHRSLDMIDALLTALTGSSAPVSPREVMALRKELRQIGMAAASASAPRSAPVPNAAHDHATLAPAAPIGAALPKTETRSAEPLPVPASGMGPAEDTVRIAVSKLEAQLLHTEDLLGAKLATRQRVVDLRELDDWFKQWHKTWTAVASESRSLRQPSSARSREPAASMAPELARMRDLFDWGDDAVRILEGKLAAIGRAARQDRDVVGKSVDNLLDSAKKLLLLPFGTTSASFPKLVRDLCRDQDKEADLVIVGEHIELDKRILEEIKDPLVHMLRNAVDHAVELPALRIAQGKPRRATITLTVSQVDGNRARIVLSDDGAGIATERVKDAAVRRGVVSAEEAARLKESVAQRLVFRSEISTGATVTRVSGRGLGLAIVRENTQRLGGKVRVRSTAGRGTRFEIVLPAIRASFRGILCEAAGRSLLMPVSLVERVARVPRDLIRTVEGRETIALGERALALVWLADVLELPRKHAAGRYVQVVVAGRGDETVAFAVDAVVDEQEVLVKPLGKPLVRVRNIAGVAVLGTGTVVPILHVDDLLQSARHGSAATQRVPSTSPASRPARSVLVAEDSITSRMLLKTILEAAGYAVTTAADGQEAFALLRSGPFDLLVSDVEMPRLNGFDLTARVRADQKLASLPVVLVTALATREDRERGIDVGANAYIVKGSFDRDTLIEAVQRLI